MLLAAARLHELHGDIAGARRMLHREYYLSYAIEHLPTMLRERARLAELDGDREAAEKAIRHYLTLRTDPDPELAPEVERMRARLRPGGD